MPLSERFEQAFLLAHRLHQSQVRKSTETPYITHLMAVSALVGENGGTEDQMIAALLHDAIEDQGGAPTGELIERHFGAHVRHLVECCTDTDQTPKPPWRERKEQYIRHLGEQPPEVMLISISDKLHNARTIVHDLRTSDSVFDRFSGGRSGTLWYYRTLLSIYEAKLQHPIVQEYAEVVARMHELSEAWVNGAAPKHGQA